MRRFLLILVLICGCVFCAAAQTLYVTPIVIDLESKNFDSGFTDVSHGVTFGFMHAGEPVEMAWTEPGRNIGFLVVNRHGNQQPDPRDEHANSLQWLQVREQWKKQATSSAGAASADEPPNFHVASGREMFGNFTNQPLSPAQFEQSKAMTARGESWQPNGFLALSFFDRKENGGNENGMIDKGDLVFTHLRVWVDTAHNGRSEDGKMYTLGELGIQSIGLNYTEIDRADRNGNHLRHVGQIAMASSSQVQPQIADVYLRTIRSAPAH
jgi:hypothetical protein